MKINDANLKKIYENLNELICLNFIIYSKEDDKISRLDNYKILENIKELEGLTCELINEKLKHSLKGYACIHKNNIKLKYIGFGIFDKDEYVGCLIIGPYIDESTYEYLIGSSDYKSFYNNIPVVSYLQEKSISFIINNLINSTLEDVKYVEIEEDNNEKSIKRILDNYDIDIVSIRRKYDLEGKILYYVAQGNEEKALDVAGKLLTYNINKNKENDLQRMKSYANNINVLIRKEVIDKNVDSFIVHSISEKNINDITKSKDSKSLEKILNKMIIEYCTLINTYMTKGYSNTVIEVIKYININFTEEISLSSIAEKMYMHPSHLARKFKSETNETISSFINKRRIREAKFLLINRKLSIEDVAYSVGYNNVKYFYKIFKQIENITPTEYKMQK